MIDECCCYYGSGEWPEFECADCPVHRGGGLESELQCSRHAHLAAGHERVQFENGLSWVHGRTQCWGVHCTIHNPSDHSMRGWPLILRKSTLLERVCAHGIGHPDPDSVAWLAEVTGLDSWGVHGCDGCCAPPQPPSNL